MSTSSSRWKEKVNVKMAYSAEDCDEHVARGRKYARAFWIIERKKETNWEFWVKLGELWEWHILPKLKGASYGAKIKRKDKILQIVMSSLRRIVPSNAQSSIPPAGWLKNRTKLSLWIRIERMVDWNSRNGMDGIGLVSIWDCAQKIK